jgi:hypothetical protein
MRKTARPVVWEGDRAYPRSLDLINDFNSLRFFAENYVTLARIGRPIAVMPTTRGPSAAKSFVTVAVYASEDGRFGIWGENL